MPAISLVELSIIKNMMLSKSHKEISELLGLPVEEIEKCIAELIGNSDVITRQMRLDLTKSLKIKKVVVKPVSEKVSKAAIKKEKKEHDDRQKEKNTREKELIESQRKVKRRESRYTIPTKVIDYSKMVRVIIDKKTFIYAKPGEEEDARAAYLKRYPKNKNDFE